MSEANQTTSVLASTLAVALGSVSHVIQESRGEVTLTVTSPDYLAVMPSLRGFPGLRFEKLLDLCGVDYSEYQGRAEFPGRFAAVVHLLSVEHNARLRVRVFASDDDFPVLGSVSELWASAAWYEREAFDLYGIVFEGHADLRRILTDYGFIGHPFRKDFPLSGHVEMRYDADRRRVVYEPITIEPRENTPRIVREENYGGLH